MLDLIVKVTGEVQETNWQEWETFIADIREQDITLTKPEDFGNAENVIKTCKEAENRIEAVRDSALKKSASVSDLLCAMDKAQNTLREVRLNLSKQVKTEKDRLKEVNIKHAIEQLEERVRFHATNVCEQVQTAFQIQRERFVEAIKGKRTESSQLKALNVVLEEETERLETMVKHISTAFELMEQAKEDNPGLFFPDATEIYRMSHKEMVATINERVATFTAEKVTKEPVTPVNKQTFTMEPTEGKIVITLELQCSAERAKELVYEVSNAFGDAPEVKQITVKRV